MVNTLGIAKNKDVSYEQNRRIPHSQMQIKISDYFVKPLDELSDKQYTPFVDILSEKKQKEISNVIN